MPEQTLSYVLNLVVQTYRKRGLDEAYIQIKTEELSHLNNIETLRYAINFLDPQNLAIFADLLGVTVVELKATQRVFGKI